MSLPRLFVHLMLVLALVASGLASAVPAAAAPVAAHDSPCHGDAAPSAAADDEAGKAGCCGGEQGYCGCDCLQHATAALPVLAFLPAIPPRPFGSPVSVQAHPRPGPPPNIRPPIA